MKYHWSNLVSETAATIKPTRVYVIGSQSVETFREWFATGRGVKVWSNLEIASGHSQQVFTPGDKPTPGWRYGNPVDLAPNDITVEHSEVLETFRGRFKARYWGPDVADQTRGKAQRLAKQHGQSEDSWRWTYAGDGLVTVEILRSSFVPFEQTTSTEARGHQ